MKNWYPVKRDWHDLELFKDKTKFVAWCFLLSKVAYKPEPLELYGTIIDLEIDQYAFSYRLLATYLQKDNKVAKWDHHKVKRFIKDLCKLNLIEIACNGVNNTTKKEGNNVPPNVPALKNNVPALQNNVPPNVPQIIIIKIKDFKELFNISKTNVPPNVPALKNNVPALQNNVPANVPRLNTTNTKNLKQEGGSTNYKTEYNANSDVSKLTQEQDAPPPLDSKNLDFKEKEYQSDLETKHQIEIFLKKKDIDQELRNNAKASLARINKKLSKIN